MQANHVVIWLDHSEAHVIAFGRESAEKAVIVHAPKRHEHQHHRADATGSGKAAEHPEYYDAIVEKIRDIPEWLVVGPANAKLAFVKHVAKAHRALNDHLIGVETVDHPTDGQLLAYARKYFVAVDRMIV
jgi:stalled ribosome rescue protein Dom34